MAKESRFAIYPLILQSQENKGERLPVLIGREDRVPVKLANEWIFAARRMAVAANTLDRDLQTIRIVYDWAADKDIDLEGRLRSGKGLTPDEISSSLLLALRKGYGRTKVRRLRVSNEHIRVRLATTHEFFDWALRRAEARFGLAGQTATERSVHLVRARITAEFKIAMPYGSARGDVQSLTQQQTIELIALISPTSPENPWRHQLPEIEKALRARNYIILRLLLTFGLRRGDLLKLYTTDVVVSGNSPILRVRRRPDDPMDPRRYEPNAKTLERDLPIDANLAAELEKFVCEVRPLIPDARRTPYLITNVKNGKPLSSRALNDVFNPLRKRFPHLHPHVCRHTCNEELRRESARLGISVARATQHAKYINGWLGDNTGIYTRRAAREEARKVSLQMQNHLFGPK